MFTNLTLERFKNFALAEIPLGPFTLILGANATGKSNIRDAFRFLHGISRGYLISDIIGLKYGEGGELEWTGIRGGAKEIVTIGHNDFTFNDFTFTFHFSHTHDDHEMLLSYVIRIDPHLGNRKVILELLMDNVTNQFIFTTIKRSADEEYRFDKNLILGFALKNMSNFFDSSVDSSSMIGIPLINDRPLISQIVDQEDIGSDVRLISKSLVGQLNSMRFYDFSVDQLRTPSLPGQRILGDRGANLSSVLKHIIDQSGRKETLLNWLRELTPMDIHDLDFKEDHTGKIMVYLKEADGSEISAASASDGTLRFLGLLAALLSSADDIGDSPNRPTKFLFFEELENGIHPSRLALLVQMIEQLTADSKIQVVATTHAPALLLSVNKDTLNNALLTYRLEGEKGGHVIRLMDVPHAREIIEQQDIDQLVQSGWFEQSLYFAADEKTAK